MRALLAVLLLVVAGCADPGADPRADPGTPSTAAPDAAPDAAELIGVGTVLDDGDGPELCLGGVMTSLPPQCGGPPVAGWDWGRVEHEEAGATRWADVAVIGTWDGETFTLAREPVPALEHDVPRPAGAEPDLSTPCPEPRGGWTPPDPDRATDAGLQRALRTANRLEGVADVWLDQSPNPAHGTERHEAMNDPALLVLNVRVAGDTARRTQAEQDLRTVWGGALCVSPAQRTRRELSGVQRQLADRWDELGLLGADASRDRVHVEVLFDDGTLQRRLDAEFGPDLVVVTSALRPYES